jgi:hypothetical protein
MSKARIIPFRSGSTSPDLSRAIPVDFNPQSLRLNFRTTGGVGAQSAKDQSATNSTRAQPTGYTAGLTVELLFDTTRDGGNVRLKTDKIAVLIQAVDENSTPSVRFQWGDFSFDGTIQSMDETLDYFSDTGVPLRATVSLSLSGFKPEVRASGGSGAGIGAGFSAGVSAGVGISAGVGVSAGASVGVGFSASASVGAGVAVGTTPLTLAQSGDTLQSLAGRAGADWKAVAAANNIDNPRQVAPGTVLDLQAGA